MNILKNPVLNIKNESSNLPVDLLSIKNFLKVDFDNDDELIIKLAKTAMKQCETTINKTLIEKTYIYSLYDLETASILLPYSPIKSIIEIRVNTINDLSHIIQNSDYSLDDVGGILNFKDKPSNMYRIDIEYIAGMVKINEELIQGLLMHIARMYEDRSGYSPIPLHALNIYSKYKQIRI